MRPELGLVCITASDRVRFRTITRTRLLQLGPEAQRAALEEIYRANLARLEAALDFCLEQSIRLYRLTSGLFPFSDGPIGSDLLGELAEEISRVGRRAIEAEIRLVMHPDQFVVLSSDNPTVVENSIGILTHHARVLDLLELPQSAWTTVEIHGGKGGRSERLVSVIRELPHGVRSRLALENDERAYGAEAILEVCRSAGVPMVFDAHHHVCHERLESYEDPSVGELVALARETWPVPEWQLVHISNGRTKFADPHHSDFIETMPSAYAEVPWIEVEAKRKEEAIARLEKSWPALAA